ncbi:MAG: hypothetical protein ACFFCS_17435 [Candidatus Hodarchaeota archaeon]
MPKDILIEYTSEDGKIVKITKDKKGRRWLEIDMAKGIKSKLESLVEDSAIKGAFKWAMKYFDRDFHLDDVIKSEAIETGLRIEENNGDFYVIEMPKEEAQKFLDVIESSHDFFAGIDEG